MHKKRHATLTLVGLPIMVVTFEDMVISAPNSSVSMSTVIMHLSPLPCAYVATFASLLSDFSPIYCWSNSCLALSLHRLKGYGTNEMKAEHT